MSAESYNGLEVVKGLFDSPRAYTEAQFDWRLGHTGGLPIRS